MAARRIGSVRINQLLAILVIIAKPDSTHSQTALDARDGTSFVSILQSALNETNSVAISLANSEISLANASWVPQPLSQGNLTITSSVRAVLDARMKAYLVSAVAGNASLEVRNLVLVNL
jgi:hypothetical protein